MKFSARNIPWALRAASLVLVSAAAVALLEWNDRRVAMSGPRTLQEFILLGPAAAPRLLLTTMVTVRQSGLLGGRFDRYRLDQVDPATGAVTLSHWWPEHSDRPYCRAATASLLWCRSRAVGFAVLDVATFRKRGVADLSAQNVPTELASDTQIKEGTGSLIISTKDHQQSWTIDPQTLTAERLDSKRVSASPPGCSKRIATMGAVRLALSNVPGKERMQFRRQTGRSRTLCEREYIAPQLLCGQPRSDTLRLGASGNLVLSHRSSLIERPTTQLRFTAIDADCRELWTFAVPQGRIVGAAFVADTLVIGVSRWAPGRDTLAGYDPASGARKWNLEL